MATQSSRKSPQKRRSNYDAQYGTKANRAKYERRSKNTGYAWGSISLGYLGYQGYRFNKSVKGFHSATGMTIRGAFKSSYQRRKLSALSARSSLSSARKAANRRNFERYYSMRTKAQRTGMRIQAARLKYTPTSSFNRRMRNPVIDLRSPGSRYRSGRNQAIAGVALVGIGAASAYAGTRMLKKHRNAAKQPTGTMHRQRRPRRDAKGRFAGSY